jgi:hypothetical protein
MTRIASVLLALFALCAAAASALAQAERPFPRPALAVEDTMAIPVTVLPDFLVEAERVTLDEILRRVAAGEARRDSLMRDQEYTLVGVITYLDDRGGGARRKREVASRVYKKLPDRYREIPLRTSGDEDIEISASAGMSERIASFAFEARNRSRFDFRILDRQILGGHIVYEIGFTPKSRFDPLPTGRAWVETNDFVVIRQEFAFTDRSPSPLFLKRIDSCIVEREKIDGQWWVIRRVLARVTLSGPARALGKVAREDIPAVADFAALLTDWRINRGIDDAIFEVKRK